MNPKDIEIAKLKAKLAKAREWIATEGLSFALSVDSEWGGDSEGQTRAFLAELDKDDD